MINKYFAEFDTVLNDSTYILSSQIEKRKINDFLGIIEGIVVFEKGKLDVLEVIRELNGKITKKKYKYHFRNLDNEMIFRYDNMPHHKHLETFPHHKHTSLGVENSNEPTLEKVMFEVELHFDE